MRCVERTERAHPGMPFDRSTGDPEDTKPTTTPRGRSLMISSAMGHRAIPVIGVGAVRANPPAASMALSASERITFRRPRPEFPRSPA